MGLCVERSLELVVGLLGIWKAGGAYVPLDPAYPPARLAFMLADAQVPLVLTQGRLVAALPTPPGVRVVCLDTDWACLAQARRRTQAVGSNATISPMSSIPPALPARLKVSWWCTEDYATWLRPRPETSTCGQAVVYSSSPL